MKISYKKTHYSDGDTSFNQLVVEDDNGDKIEIACIDEGYADILAEALKKSISACSIEDISIDSKI